MHKELLSTGEVPLSSSKTIGDHERLDHHTSTDVPDLGMDWQTLFFLIGLMVGTFLVLWVLGRPLAPKVRHWVVTHRHWTQTGVSVGMIIWGAGIWYSLIAHSNYSNIFAIVMASFLVVIGICFLVRQLLR